MIAGAKDANAYIAEMGQDVRPLVGDDVEKAVATLVAEIEAEFTMDRLNEFVRCGGFHPDHNEPLPKTDHEINEDPS